MSDYACFVCHEVYSMWYSYACYGPVEHVICENCFNTSYRVTKRYPRCMCTYDIILQNDVKTLIRPIKSRMMGCMKNDMVRCRSCDKHVLLSDFEDHILYNNMCMSGMLKEFREKQPIISKILEPSVNQMICNCNVNDIDTIISYDEHNNRALVRYVSCAKNCKKIKWIMISEIIMNDKWIQMLQCKKKRKHAEMKNEHDDEDEDEYDYENEDDEEENENDEDYIP